MKIIEKTIIQGMDWHDMCILIDYINRHNTTTVLSEPIKNANEPNFDITGLSPDLLIADDIYNILNDMGIETSSIDGIVEKESIPKEKIPRFQEIVTCLSEKREWTLDNDVYDYSAEICFKDDGAISLCTNTNGFQYNTSYRVKDIPDKDVLYLALEEIYAPYKGAYTIQRIYEKPFKTYKEAKEALDRIPDSREGYDTAKVVQIASVADTESRNFDTWFKANMKMKAYEEQNPGTFLLSL
ncbi:MAG: hypothetical protein J5525_13300 [Lachnospiraceae bacterium]|nr:hypothetical protein [Lachnospiraceae bacterium]